MAVKGLRKTKIFHRFHSKRFTGGETGVPEGGGGIGEVIRNTIRILKVITFLDG